MTLISELKKELINNTEALIEVLEHYKYYNIKKHGNYISFGRDEESSSKAIVIYLTNNDRILVKDFPLNIDDQDIFTYIIQQRNVRFKDVLNTIKKALGITSLEIHYKPKTVFGGWYDKIKPKKDMNDDYKTYPDMILENYEPVGNLRFLRDNISLETQRFFGIRFDPLEEGIIIPIRNEIGSLMGIKLRRNYDDENDRYKYYFVLNCKESLTLYGYYENYEYLINNTVYIFEAEKSVMQCHSYGIRNCVALGSGSISGKQVELLLQLNPKKVVFLHDNSYEKESIFKNIKAVKNYSPFYDIPVGYWDYTLGNYPEKCSPSDLGMDKLNYIIQNEVVMYEEV